jgi:hypothetical protein
MISLGVSCRYWSLACLSWDTVPCDKCGQVGGESMLDPAELQRSTARVPITAIIPKRWSWCSFFFSFGGPSPYASGSTSALWLIVLSPVLDVQTISHTSSALPRPLSTENWTCNSCNLDVLPTFATSRLRENPSSRKVGTTWGREMCR